MLLDVIAMKCGKKLFYEKNGALNIKINKGLFYIRSGIIKILYGHTKSQAIAIDIFKTGEFFGYLDCACPTSDGYIKLVFLEDTELMFLDNDTIYNRSIMDNNIRVNFLKIIRDLLQNSIERQFLLSMLKKSEVIVHMLYYLANKFGKVLNNGKIMITIKLTFIDFKELCNTTRENVSRTLSNLIKERILERKNGYLIISSKEDLNALILYNYLA